MKSKFSKARLIFLYVFITLAWIILLARLGTIQLVHGSEYGEKARAQSSGKTKVQAERGIIYDRTGREVAINVVGSSLSAYPRNKSEIAEIYRYLDRINNWRSGTSRNKYRLKPEKFKWIKRNLPDNLAAQIARDSVPGLYLRKGQRRDYPFDEVGRQILGNTDIDYRGLSGLEYSHDSLLAGLPGLIDFLRDGKNKTYNLREVPLVKPVTGKSIVLTLDWYFQEIVEDELKSAVKEFNALSGTAVFLDCHTGEILAAADFVDDSSSNILKLRAISDCFEPGSVLKIVTAAALLDENLVDLDEKVYCEKGLWRCGRRRLHDDKKYDTLTIRQIIELSSNIGIGKLAQRLGGDKLKEAFYKFGFGQRLRVDLPGEASGAIGEPGVWSEYNIAALAMGHAISATPLQLAAAVSAVANGGELYRPHVIKGVIDSDNRTIRYIDREFIGRVMDEDKAATLRSFMTGVVERGTATPVQSGIISIAGKTGTAEIPDSDNGGYRKNRFNASFAGYFPAEKPRIAGIVILNQPEPVHYGGYTAGPAFRRMAERYTIANSEMLKPNTRLKADGDESEMIEVTDFVGRDYSFALTMARRDGLALKTNRESGLVVWQYPPASRKIPGTEKVAVLVESNDDDNIVMADLVGLNMRTALAVLNYQGIAFELEGCGVVKKQFPKMGTKISKKTKCRLVCGNG